MALVGAAIRLSRATMRRIKQNLLWAFIAIALGSQPVIIKSALLKGMELASK